MKPSNNAYYLNTEWSKKIALITNGDNFIVNNVKKKKKLTQWKFKVLFMYFIAVVCDASWLLKQHPSASTFQARHCETGL